MKFKGTIIITDPCYIIEEKKLPKDLVYPDYSKYVTHNKDEDYSDYRNGRSKTLTKELDNYQEAIHCYYKECEKYNDWEKCEYGENMSALGLTKYISEDTIYGDWSCTTFKTKEDSRILLRRLEELVKRDEIECLKSEIEKLDPIGLFCADAGMVAVFLLDEVLQYNPNFEKWMKEHSWCVTKIDDFDGDVEYYLDGNCEAHIYGIGNINFITTQTGL